MKIAKSLDDLPGRDVLLGMSGLEAMRAMLEGRHASAPMAQTLGYWLTEVADGRVAFRGAPGFETTNPMGGVHGGWYGTVLDSALGCAVMTKVPQGSIYTTLEYKISLTRAIPIDMEVECVAVIDHAGRTTAVAHGEIRGVEDGKLYATGSTTCLIMKMG